MRQPESGWRCDCSSGLPAVARAAPSFRASSPLLSRVVGLVLLIVWTFKTGAWWGREEVKRRRSGVGAAWEGAARRDERLLFGNGQSKASRRLDKRRSRAYLMH